MDSHFAARPVPADFDVKHSEKPIRPVAAGINFIYIPLGALSIHGVDRWRAQALATGREPPCGVVPSTHLPAHAV